MRFLSFILFPITTEAKNNIGPIISVIFGYYVLTKGTRA